MAGGACSTPRSATATSAPTSPTRSRTRTWLGCSCRASTGSPASKAGSSQGDIHPRHLVGREVDEDGVAVGREVDDRLVVEVELAGPDRVAEGPDLAAG